MNITNLAHNITTYCNFLVRACCFVDIDEGHPGCQDVAPLPTPAVVDHPPGRARRPPPPHPPHHPPLEGKIASPQTHPHFSILTSSSSSSSSDNKKELLQLTLSIIFCFYRVIDTVEMLKHVVGNFKCSIISTKTASKNEMTVA